MNTPEVELVTFAERKGTVLSGKERFPLVTQNQVMPTRVGEAGNAEQFLAHKVGGYYKSVS